MVVGKVVGRNVAGIVGLAREYAESLNDAGLSRWERGTALGGLIWKVSLMVSRGTALKPFLGQALSTPLIGRDVRIRGAAQVVLGRRVIIEDLAEIQATSREGIVLGDSVSIGAMCMIRPSGYYSRLGVGLRVGDRTGVGPYCYFGCSGGIEVGDDVLMGPGVMLFSEDHEFESTCLPIKNQGVTWKPIVIEDDCWLGGGVRVTGGVRIGRGSVVGAGSVVTRDLPPWSVSAGMPARVLRLRRDLEDTCDELKAKS